MGSGTLTRGDVVLIATGKPRPAIVVQSDSITTKIELLVCPFTSHLLDAEFYRPTVLPTSANGLKTRSQLMVDKTAPVLRSRIDRVIGRLDRSDLLQLDAALELVFGLGG